MCGSLLIYPIDSSTINGIQTGSFIPFNSTMCLRLLAQEISEPQVRALSTFRTRTLRRFCSMLVQRLVSFARLDQSASTCFRTCLARLEPCISSRSKKIPAVKNLPFPLIPNCCAPVSSPGRKCAARIGMTYLPGARSLQAL